LLGVILQGECISQRSRCKGRTKLHAGDGAEVSNIFAKNVPSWFPIHAPERQGSLRGDSPRLIAVLLNHQAAEIRVVAAQVVTGIAMSVSSPTTGCAELHINYSSLSSVN
jgi:hypothetical protein